MKYIFYLILSIFPISAIIFHLWTTFIAFDQGGFWGGLISFIFPFISEIYWCFKVWGENSTYTTIAIIHFLGAFLYGFSGNNNKN